MLCKSCVFLLADVASIVCIVYVVGFAKYWDLVVHDEWATVLLIVMAIDFVMGTILSVIRGEWQIAKMVTGILKKTVLLLAVGFFFAIQRMYPASPQFGHWAIGVVVIFIEGKSIIQNVAKAGIDAPVTLPGWLSYMARLTSKGFDRIDDETVITSRFEERRDRIRSEAVRDAVQSGDMIPIHKPPEEKV